LLKIPDTDRLIFFGPSGIFRSISESIKEVALDSDEKHAKFATVITPYLADAYTLARWLMHNRTDADDILQEACIRALGAVDQHSGSNARAWLLAIVRNTAYTWLNDKHRKMLVGMDDLAEKDLVQVEQGGGHGDATIDPESEMIARADAKRLEALITGLPMEFRETLVLRDIQGLGYREIAEITGVPVGTVMSRLARARQRLIAALREDNS
jgi:RNA polymerase sigma factor (sigma-70 family)